MLQIWFLYFWPKEETCTVFVFKLVEVSLSWVLAIVMSMSQSWGRIKALTILEKRINKFYVQS